MDQHLRGGDAKLGKGPKSVQRQRNANSPTAAVSKLGKILFSVSMAARVSNVATRENGAWSGIIELNRATWLAPT